MLAASLTDMLADDPQALYRTRAKDGTLLYIGKSNDPLRRSEEHRRSKDWMPYSAVRIDLEWYAGLAAVLEAEARAIRTEHPVYNIQHNRGRIRIEASVTAEVETSPASLFALGAGAVGLAMLAKWAFDWLATWRVRQMTERDGLPFEAPVVRNPFTEDPPGAMQKMLWFCVAAAAASGSKDEQAMAAFSALVRAEAQPAGRSASD